MKTYYFVQLDNGELHAFFDGEEQQARAFAQSQLKRDEHGYGYGVRGVYEMPGTNVRAAVMQLFDVDVYYQHQFNGAVTAYKIA